ncbi:MAG: YhgE/Pip domain-containing protein [Anaerovorax sp.]
MKNIIKIFIGDIKGICKNWVAIIIVLGLIVIPSLYAWINILASTDPYGTTDGIKVAVVNLDQGGTILGERVDIGKEVITSLKDNKKLGWTFYDTREKAIEDTTKGNVYAAIIIPENFSAKLCTMLDHPEKPSLEYYVNMKKNAIAPKMTGAGANGLQSQIKESLIDTVVVKVYKELNNMGITLDEKYNSIEKFKNFLYDAEGQLPKVQEGIDGTVDLSKTALNTVDEKQADVVRIQKMLQEAKTMTGSLNQDLLEVDRKIRTIEPDLLGILEDAGDISGEVKMTSQKLLDTKANVDKILDKLIVYNLLLDRLNELLANSGKQTVTQKVDAVNGLVVEINQLSGDIRSLVATVSQDLKGETLPKVHDYLKDGAGLADEANWGVEYGISESAKLMTLMGKIDEVGVKFITAMEKLAAAWPAYEDKVTALIEKVRAVDANVNLETLIQFLREDATTEGNFFASPVQLETHELFPMKNYGAAMTPFYTTLCLWVGALILCALLTTSAKNADFAFTMKQEFFGKWLLFAFLAMLQGVVVALGDMFVLGIHVAHPTIFVALAAFYSLVFITIVYTFVAQLGNVGKAMGVILLVIQIAGSGGTFPIEVTPTYFQSIYAILPFTYGIDGMREAVAGIVPENLRTDVLVLGMYLGAFLLLGLVSKHWIRKATFKFNHKLEESGITEH